MECFTDLKWRRENALKLKFIVTEWMVMILVLTASVVSRGVDVLNYFYIFYYGITYLILFMLFSVCVAESLMVKHW